MAFKNFSVKWITYPLGAGVALIFIGQSNGDQALTSIGMLGLIPLAIAVFAGIAFAFFGMLDSVIPKFKGRDTMIYLLVGVFVVLFLLQIFSGGDSSACIDPSGNDRC